MNSATSTNNPTERREHLELRTVFIEAYDVIRPYFDDANAWAGHTHEHLAFRALHEHFPAMSGEQVLTIIAAAKRVFGSGGSPAP